MFGIPDETKTIRAQLLAAMKDGEYSGCDRLPRESVLSELLGINFGIFWPHWNEKALSPAAMA